MFKRMTGGMLTMLLLFVGAASVPARDRSNVSGEITVAQTKSSSITPMTWKVPISKLLTGGPEVLNLSTSPALTDPSLSALIESGAVITSLLHKSEIKTLRLDPALSRGVGVVEPTELLRFGPGKMKPSDLRHPTG